MDTTSRAGDIKDEVEVRLQSTIAFMAREFRRNPRLSEIARVAHFSEYHFHRLFRKRFGKTPKQMLVELQIEDVKRQMLAGQRPADAARPRGLTPVPPHVALPPDDRMTPRQWLLAARHARGDDPEEAVTRRGCKSPRRVPRQDSPDTVSSTGRRHGI